MQDLKKDDECWALSLFRTQGTKINQEIVAMQDSGLEQLKKTRPGKAWGSSPANAQDAGPKVQGCPGHRGAVEPFPSKDTSKHGATLHLESERYVNQEWMRTLWVPS